MDQLRVRVGSQFGIEELGGQGIDDPAVAQPSIVGVGNPEAGSADGSLDARGEYPAEGRPDVPAEVTDTDNVGTDNIREGNVVGVMGGPRQAQGEGQGG